MVVLEIIQLNLKLSTFEPQSKQINIFFFFRNFKIYCWYCKMQNGMSGTEARGGGGGT